MFWSNGGLVSCDGWFRLQPLLKKFKLRAYFQVDEVDRDGRENKYKEGELRFVEIVHRKERTQNLIESLKGFTLTDVHRLLKKMGFRELRQNKKLRKKREYRWTNC
ncbi:MAG: hypothetical protein AAB458_02260 [Patescibacteria group bacterium]